MSDQIFLVNDLDRWTPQADPIAGHRTEAWRVDLLNLQDVSVARLDGVTGGDLTFNASATIRGGGRLEYQGKPIDWLRHRVQPWYRTTSGTATKEWPLGVFIPVAPRTGYGPTAGRAQTLELYDKTQLLAQDAAETTFSVAAGARVTDAVRAVLAAAGETRVAIADSTETLGTTMVWNPGTPKLRIINELLAAINYFAIWADGWGTLHAEPYRRPADRPVRFNFADDEQSIYLPNFSHDYDTYYIPNKVVLLGQSDGEVPARTAVATNEDPENPFSYQARGSWITRTEEGVEATSQEVLDGIATRYLAEGQNVGSTYEISHAPIELSFNDTVTFRRSAEGIELLGSVESISYSLTTGAMCATKLREVKE